MIIELDFQEINKTVKNSTAKPRNSSLWIYQRHVEILSVYIKRRLTLRKDYNRELKQTDAAAVRRRPTSKSPFKRAQGQVNSFGP